MNKRRALGLATLATLIAGLCAAWIPFGGYLQTGDVAVDRYTVEVPLASLAAGEFRIMEWNDTRLFVAGGDGEPTVLSLPYDAGAYLLPNPTPDRAYVRCAIFGPVGGQLRCLDPDTPRAWRQRARWGLDGAALDEDFPALRSVRYRIVGGALVVDMKNE